MRGGNHGKIKLEFHVAPEIARALMLLRAADEGGEVHLHRLRRYVAEVVVTYVPFLFEKRFHISISELSRRYPVTPGRPFDAKLLPGIVADLLKFSPTGREPAVAANRGELPAGFRNKYRFKPTADVSL